MPTKQSQGTEFTKESTCHGEHSAKLNPGKKDQSLNSAKKSFPYEVHWLDWLDWLDWTYSTKVHATSWREPASRFPPPPCNPASAIGHWQR